MSSTASTRPAVPHYVAATFIYLVAALASTYPLVWRLDSALPGGGFGDNVTSLWNVWWFDHALQHGQPLFWTPMLFAPFGTQLVLHTHATTHSVLAWPLLQSTSVVAAHNLVTLLALTLNGVVTFALARRFAGGFVAPLAAGALFAASSFVHVHLLGHTNLVHAWVLPLFALMLFRLLQTPAWSHAVGLGIAAAVVVYTDYYYAVFCALFAATWILANGYSIRLRLHRRTPSRFVVAAILALIVIDLAVIGTIAVTGGTSFELAGQRISLRGLRNPLTAFWALLLAWTLARYAMAVRVQRRSDAARIPIIHVAVALAAAAVAILPLVLAAARVVSSGDYVSQRVLWRSSPAGADLLTLVLGHPQHAVTGAATRAVYASLGIDVIEQSLWVGVVPLVLLLASREWRRQPGARMWLVVVGVFFVLSLGPFLRVGGFDTALPLPQAALRYVPVLSNARMPGRAVVVTQLALAVLLAMALASRGRSRAVSIGVVALALVEALPGRVPFARVPPADNVDAALAAAASPGSVLELPTGIRDGFGETGPLDHRALVHQMAHERPLVGGFVARLSPRVRASYLEDPALARLLGVVDPGSDPAAGLAGIADGLGSLGVRFLVVNRDTEAGARLSHESIVGAGFVPVARDGARALYELPASRR